MLKVKCWHLGSSMASKSYQLEFSPKLGCKRRPVPLTSTLTITAHTQHTYTHAHQQSMSLKQVLNLRVVSEGKGVAHWKSASLTGMEPWPHSTPIIPALESQTVGGSEVEGRQPGRYEVLSQEVNKERCCGEMFVYLSWFGFCFFFLGGGKRSHSAALARWPEIPFVDQATLQLTPYSASQELG